MGREKNHSTEKEMSCEELEAPREGTEAPWGADQTPGGQHWLSRDDKEVGAPLPEAFVLMP